MEYKPYYTNMRPALTIIELVFVITIIGILGSVAMSKVSALRDDAKIITDVASMSACISDAGMYYTSLGKDLKAGDSDNCDSVKCFDITYGSSGSNFKVTTKPGGADYCDRVEELGGHLARTYNFHGNNVSL